MAKLNVEIPANEVRIEGATYRKVDRKAAVGDVVKVLTRLDDLTTGAFYEVVADEDGDPTIYDDVNDSRYGFIASHTEKYEVYEKVGEPPYQYKPGDTVRSIMHGHERVLLRRKPECDSERHGTAWALTNGFWLGEKQFELVRAAESAPSLPDEFTLTYEKIGEGNEAGPQIGDVIVFEEAPNEYITAGKRYDVVGLSGDDAEIIDDDGDEWDTAGEEFALYRKKVEAPKVSEEQAKPERLKVGEYAKVVDDTDRGGRKRSVTSIGELRIIAEDDRSVTPFKAKLLDGTDYHWFRAASLVRATDEEVAEAKRKLAEGASKRPVIGQTVRVTENRGGHFAKVGDTLRVWDIVNYGTNQLRCERLDGSRKCNDYFFDDEIEKLTEMELAELDRIPVGSYVRVLVDSGDLPKGAIGKVTEDDHDSCPYRVDMLDGSDYDWYKRDQIEVLMGAEAEKAVAEAAETAKWAAIGRKVGEYKEGDVVRFTETTGEDDYGRGGVVVISDLNDGRFTYGRKRYGAQVEWCELIVPVESRFDRGESKGGVA